MVEENRPMKYVVGIDLGTTNSCVALWNPHNQEVEILQGEAGNDSTPSWICVTENGDTIVGEDAKNPSLPLRVFDAKRMIGRAFKDEHV